MSFKSSIQSVLKDVEPLAALRKITVTFAPLQPDLEEEAVPQAFEYVIRATLASAISRATSAVDLMVEQAGYQIIGTVLDDSSAITQRETEARLSEAARALADLGGQLQILTNERGGGTKVVIRFPRLHSRPSVDDAFRQLMGRVGVLETAFCALVHLLPPERRTGVISALENLTEAMDSISARSGDPRVAEAYAVASHRFCKMVQEPPPGMKRT